MSSLSQWIIVILIQIFFNANGVLSGGDDGEHVHIKVHIPEVHRTHTHFKKIKKHQVNSKKLFKMPEYLDADLDVTPVKMMSYGISDSSPSLQFPIYPMGLPSLPDIPNFGVDNTLEASIVKKPKINSMSHMISEGMFSRFHGMKRPSEFLGARPVAEMQQYTTPMSEEENESAYTDDYDSRSQEAIELLDQRVAGSSHPDAMSFSDSFKPKWQSYVNIYEPSMKTYMNEMSWPGGLSPGWISATTENDYLDRFPSTTTMHITRAKPLSSSRQKFEQHSYNRSPFSESWVLPKKKKKSKNVKRSRKPSPGFRINY